MSKSISSKTDGGTSVSMLQVLQFDEFPNYLTQSIADSQQHSLTLTR